MRLTCDEKKYAVVAGVIASLLTAFAALIAYGLVKEGYFHGGILEEDRAHANWNLIYAAATAFVKFGIGAYLVIGVLPVVLRRFLKK